MSALSREELEGFLEVARHRSIGAASRETGRSRATYLRQLEHLREVFDAPVLLERARGQRQGWLTPEGEELAQRARQLLAHWERWEIAARDAIGRARAGLRVGALAGSFDLIADLLGELRGQRPELALRVTELPEERLPSAVTSGEVDLAFGSVDPEGSPPNLAVESLGELTWAVIVPAHMLERFPDPVHLTDLDGVPMVVLRAGPARERVERAFAQHEGGPLVLDPAYEVASTPRAVEMVARGFGPAIVSRFRVAFLPDTVGVRALVHGPEPLTAAVYMRKGYRPTDAASWLIGQARARFRELSRLG